MSSRFSSSPDRPLAFGRVSGFRGRSGEITVRVASGRADRWLAVGKVWLGEQPGSGCTRRAYEVEGARCYRDRLVLKLEGIDDPSKGESLKGLTVFAPPEEIPELPEEQHFAAGLIGLRVRVDPTGESLGTVTDLVETGGPDVLVVEQPDGHELLIPMAGEIVVEIQERAGTISVRLPEGLRELNRSKDDA